MEKINIADKFSRFQEQWSPKIIGKLNGQEVKIAKIQGEFIWHSHEQEDELFLVIDGHVTIKLRDRDIELEEGEMFIVPKGVEHKPVAEQEAQILMFEPASTRNTGNIESERTVSNPEEL